MIFFKLTFVNSNSIDVDKSQLEGVAVNFFQTYMQDFCTWIKVKKLLHAKRVYIPIFFSGRLLLKEMHKKQYQISSLHLLLCILYHV